MTTRPYAGQAWIPGILSGGQMPLQALQLIVADLIKDAALNGISAGDIELWKNSDGSKGFFLGDTRDLVALGWTKVATL
jgi:hypothetical protein